MPTAKRTDGKRRKPPEKTAPMRNRPLRIPLDFDKTVEALANTKRAKSPAKKVKRG